MEPVEPKPKPTKTIKAWKPKVQQMKEQPYMIEALLALKEQSKPKKIYLQALNLQIKLFHYTSILLPRKSWLEFVWK